MHVTFLVDIIFQFLKILGGSVSVLYLDRGDDNMIVYAGKTHLTIPLKGSEFYYM